MKQKRGITLIALVITIIVLLILAAITIGFVFGENGIIDRAKKAGFNYTIRGLEEQARLKVLGEYGNGKENVEIISHLGELTKEQKDEVVTKIPTLSESIAIATGQTIYDRPLYVYDTKELTSNGRKYLIDMQTLQVYDYKGQTFLKQIWHTLDIGIPDDGTDPQNDPDGYMRIHLQYPEEAVDRQWRISRPGEVRQNENLVWQDYTGPILVKIEDIKNIWIRYNLKGKDVVKAPDGQVAVDIRANPVTDLTTQVEIEIYFEEGSKNQFYQVGESGWLPYQGKFVVTQNCVIQAKAEKEIDVLDQEGKVIGTTTIKGKDSYQVGNIGEKIENASLPAPTIEEVSKQGSEKTRAQITYPTNVGTIRKVYTINYGEEQEYTQTIPILEWGTNLQAYYYNEAGEKSPQASKTFEDPTKLEVEINVLPNPQVDKTTQEVIAIIEYSQQAEQKTYKINNGIEQAYTQPLRITQNCTITAYARKQGVTDAVATQVIQFEEEPVKEIQAPIIYQTINAERTKAMIQIQYDEVLAVSKQYGINAGALQNYTQTFWAEDGDIIYAINTDKDGNSRDTTFTVSLTPENPNNPNPPIKEEIKAPVISQTANADKTQATITISYDTVLAVSKQYSINGGALQEYQGSFTAVNGDIIYAINTDKDGNSKDTTFTVVLIPDNPSMEEIKAPTIQKEFINDKQAAKISISYDETLAVSKQYSIDGGALQTYTGPFEVQKNGTVIYAINTDKDGNSKDTTFIVTGIMKKLDVSITATPEGVEASSVSVKIDYDTRATSRTYTINGGEEQNYTGAFTVTQNCTIRAIAKDNEDGYGETQKQITNLPNGIAAPIFQVTKTTETQGEVANVSIVYDAKATIKKYSINGGELQDYTGSFQVRENGTKIYAYSMDNFGNTANNSYEVNGLIRYLLIDKGKYYWITLPYPESATNKQYKYKEDGIWKNYKEDGFILVKSEYESELIQGRKTS